MTAFDHFFILYTGLVIGIICFVFPLIISLFNFFEKKRQEEEEKINNESENELNESIKKINSPDTKKDERRKEIQKSSKNIRREKWEKMFNQFYYSPQFRIWIILIPLLITLVMCTVDIFTEHKHHLTYWSFMPFIFAMFFLIDTSVRAVKLIKDSM